MRLIIKQENPINYSLIRQKISQEPDLNKQLITQ
jgi:hypothetical protein